MHARLRSSNKFPDFANEMAESCQAMDIKVAAFTESEKSITCNT